MTSHSKVQSKKFQFFEGEKVASLTLWASSFHTGRSGGFQINTSHGCSFKACVRESYICDSYKPEVGCGLLTGVFGRGGEDLDCLGFALLIKAESKCNMHP